MIEQAKRVGWAAADVARLQKLAGGTIEAPEDLRRVIDRYGYAADWRSRYHIRSARASLYAERITCIDAAILSYALLELACGGLKRRLLAIHRRDGDGEECGHCVALYWNGEGRVGSLSKSSFVGLGHRDAVYDDEAAVAMSYAQAYVAIGFEPLWFGVTTLEDVASGLDWRFSTGPLNAISDRLKERYEYAFATRGERR